MEDGSGGTANQNDECGIMNDEWKTATEERRRAMRFRVHHSAFIILIGPPSQP
jgi:hypothetical protein